MDKDFWRERLIDLVKYVAENPYEFVFYLVLLLSPLLIVSAILSYKLAKQIEAQEKAKKKEEKRKSNIQKARAKKTD